MTQYSRQVQTQAQQQVQTLSPQQILVVKLLELPTLELEERIHSELLDNPALEEGKEPSEDHEDHEDNFATDEDGEPNSDYGEGISGRMMTFQTINFRRTTVPKEKRRKRFLFRTMSRFMKP